MKIIVLSLLLVSVAGFWFVSGSSEKQLQKDGTAYPEAAPRDPEDNISGEVIVPEAPENFIEN